jgi:hypothetical protein
MDDQTVNITFCLKVGKNATGTHNLIQQVYGDEALSRTHLNGISIFVKNVKQCKMMQVLAIHAPHTIL